MDGDVEKSNVDVSSGYPSLYSHTISKCKYSITFKDMDGDVENGDISSGYGYMKTHADLQHNSLESLINDNDRNDIDMNYNLQNGYMINITGLLNSQNTPQYNESSNFNDMNMSVYNGDVNGDYYYINSTTVSESNNQNYINYTKKRWNFWKQIFKEK